MIAARQGQGGLFFRAHGADHRGANAVRPLAKHQADAAGGGVEQAALARSERVGSLQQVFGGLALEHDRRGLFEINALRNRHQPRRRQVERLGVGAEAG